MKILLDTHILLWWLNDDAALSPFERKVIADPDNIVYISSASLWEIIIKEQLGKVQVAGDLNATLSDEPFEKLAMTSEHVFEIRDLPNHHRDPFDRMLIAQAIVEGCTLISHDREISKYPATLLKS